MTYSKSINTLHEFEKLKKSAARDPGQFHGEIAKREIFWFDPNLDAWVKRVEGKTAWIGYDAKTGKKLRKVELDPEHEPWDKAFDDSQAPFYQWFRGGLTNACFNEVDVHIMAGRGDEIALIFEGALWSKEKNEPQSVVKKSRKELLWEVAKHALVLKDLGLRKGDRIVLNMPNILEQIYFIEAAKRLGIIYTSVFGGFSAKTLAERIQHAGATVAITTDGAYNNGQIVSFKNEYVDKAIDEHIATTENQSTLTKVVVVEYAPPEGMKWIPGRDLRAADLLLNALDKLFKTAASLGIAVEKENDFLSLSSEKFLEIILSLIPPIPVDAEFPLFIIYTSGSTGKPKGVVHTHGGYVAGIAHTMKIVFNVDPQALVPETIYVVADPGWITGQSYMISAALTTRTTSIISDTSPLYPNAGRFASIIERHKANIFKAGSTFIKTIASSNENIEEVNKYDLSSLRVATFCAEPTSPEIQNFAMQLITPNYINSYWGTEHGGIILTHFYGNKDFKLKPDAHSFPLPWIFSEVWVPKKPFEVNGVTYHEYELAGDEEKGEIVITKPYPYLVRTLWGDAGNVGKPGWKGDFEAFRNAYFERWVKHGKTVLVYTQGDFASKHSDGSMSLHGRSDDVIKTSGNRISTEEIKHAILRDREVHPNSRVRNVIVAAGPHRERGTVPYAFILTEGGKGLSSEEEARLINLVRIEKGSLAIPEGFICLSQFPETRSGKYMRRFLQNMLAGEVIGDRSTLKNPESLEEIADAIEQFRFRQHGDPRPEELKLQLAAATAFDRKEIISQLLEKLIRETLGITPEKRISTDRGFFDLGLTSTLSQVLTEKLQRHIGDMCQLGATVFFDYPTIDSLAGFIVRDRSIQEKNRPAELKENFHEPIAVIGMGCRFPGGSVDPESFWKTLQNSVDGIVDIPSERWNIQDYYDANPDAVGKMATQKGGFLDNIDRFDADFFGINPREAELIDPQQRILLEVCWEALERSGIAPESIRNSLTGVFVGVSYSDYGTILLSNGARDQLSLHFGTGTALNAVSGRVSYVFGFNGPCMSIDTACSSSLVSVHTACKSLQNNECNLALAGGANILLQPDIFVAFSRGHMLAPDAHCKTFDAKANGYGRGEGVGVVVLKRLSDAQRDRDPILAVIRGSSVNQHGSSSGLTVPNGPAQEQLMIRALKEANTNPEQVSYIEAHGTGTELGDPIEVSAIAQVYRRTRKEEHPLMLGAVKSNIGHLESAAGIASLIKVVLSLSHREIPPNLHFTNLNPKIDLAAIPGKIINEPTPWTDTSGQTRKAGISSFGFSGTIAHMIVEEAAESESEPLIDNRSSFLLTLSAKSDWALEKLLEKYQRFLENTKENIADIVHTANTGRNHFEYRAAITAKDTRELAEKIKARIFSKGKIAAETMPTIHFEYTEGSNFEIRGSGTLELNIKVGTNSDWNKLLEKLAEFYIKGSKISWEQFEAPFSRNKVIIPTYPFNPQRFWAKFKTRTEQPGLIDENLNPMLGRQIVTQAKDRIIFETHVSAEWPFFFPYHKVFDYVVIAGHCYLSGALSALERINNGVGYVEQVEWLQPVILPENMRRCLQTIFTPSAEGHMDFKVISCDEEILYTDPQWVEHASGRVSLERSKIHFEGINTEEVIARCKEQLSKDALYEKLSSMGLQLFDPHFQWIEKLYYNEGEMLAKFRLPLESEKKNFVLFPGCIDGCAQAHIAREVILEGGGLLRIPLAIGEYSFDKSKGYLEWVYFKKKHDANSDEIAYLLNGKGEFLGAQVNFRTREVTPEALKKAIVKNRSVDQWFYSQNWKELPLPPGTAAANQAKWIVFDSEQRTLFKDDNSLIRVIPGKQFKKVNDSLYQINPENPNDYDVLIGELGKDARGFIHLWSPEHSNDFSVKNFYDLQTTVSKSALYLAHSLLKHSQFTELPVCFVTIRAQAFQTPSTNLHSAPMLGFLKTLVLEQPQLHWKLLDIDEFDAQSMDSFKAECAEDVEEHFLCYRKGVRYAARLEQRKLQKPSESVSLYSDGSYIITGGLGGLGLTLANWLIEHGAGKVALLGRTAPSKEVAKKLEILGDKVVVHRVDISKENEVKLLFETYQKSSTPIKGIFHLAGVLQDAPLDTQTWGKFESVYLSKVDGGWNLHRQSLEQRIALDMFVVYSSTASMIGSVGQINYSAANSFLDSLTAYRLAEGLPSKAIHWGPWKDVGMAAGLVEHHKKYGINATAPEDNMDAFERVLLSDLNDVMISSIEWKKYLEQIMGNNLWLSNFSQPKAKEVQVGFLEAINKLPVDERETFIKREVENVVKSVLGFDMDKPLAEDRKFYDLGMDSLFSVELRNKLQDKLGQAFKLSMTAVYDFETLGQLSKHIAEGLGVVAASREVKPKELKKGQILILNPKDSQGEVRLFCFPSGGSGASLFQGWRENFPDLIDLAFVQLPGREQRMGEPAIISHDELMKELLAGIEPYLDKPFAFFGHSLGGLIAINLADELIKINKPMPANIYISAVAPEEIFLTKFNFEAMLKNSDDGFIQDVQKYFKGIPHSILEQPDLLSLFLPVLRHDFQLANSFATKERHLPIPIIGFLGESDPAFTKEELATWKNHSSSSFELIAVKGDHFALLDNPKQYIDVIIKTLVTRGK